LSVEIFNNSFDQLWPLLKPMTIGGVPIGILIGSIAYFIVKKASETYRAKRRRKKQRALGRGQPAQA
jgi:hypothetical protein